MQTPFDTLVEQAQPDTTKILAAPFLVSDRISKRAQLLESFQKIIICESAGIFVAQQRHKNPGFFFFKKDADFSAPFSQPFSYFREDGFFRFLTLLFRARKRAPDFFQILVPGDSTKGTVQ